MSKTPPSITDQLRAAIDSAGGQAAVMHRILGAGGKIRRATMSELYGGQRPSLEALRDIAKVTGYRFEITGETELGTSRASRPSEASEEAQKRKPRAKGS
jgi:hypothetical protein